MSSRKVIWPAFILVVFVQVYIPAKMIWDRENILESGTEYKFKTTPIDPNDPFRGKFIVLNFDANMVHVKDEKKWTNGEKVYVYLGTNQDGFAKVRAVSQKKPPAHRQDFIKAKVHFISDDGSNRLTIAYPFDRFYMDEFKADAAEQLHRETQKEKTKATYALVKVKDGDSVLKDVLIHGVSIREMVKTKTE